MYNFIFHLYSLAGERAVTVGECSSGDFAIFLILSRKKKKTGAITSAGFYIVPYILCERKSIYNILRTGKMLLFSSSMGAMHGDMAKMHTLLL